MPAREDDAVAKNVVLVVMLRTDPGAGAAEIGRLLRTVTAALTACGAGEKDIVAFRTFTACEYLVVARTSSFSELPPIPHIACLKKMRIVLGLENPNKPLHLFEPSAAEHQLAFITFAKLHESLLLAAPREVAAQVGRELSVIEGTSACRGLGWADTIVFSTDNDVAALNARVPEGLCNWCLRDVGILPATSGGTGAAGNTLYVDFSEVADHISRGTTPGAETAVFSRCFTIVGYRLRLSPRGAPSSELDRVTGVVSAAMVRICVKPNGRAKLAEAVAKLERSGWHLLSCKGYPDFVAVVHLPDGAGVDFGRFLRDYERVFLRTAAPAIFSAPVDILTAPDAVGESAVVELDLPSMSQAPPEQFAGLVCATPQTGGRDIIGQLHRMYWTCNRRLANRVQFPYVIDIALSNRALAQYLDGVALQAEIGGAATGGGNEAVTATFDLCRNIASRVSEALWQRSHGDYYDLFTDGDPSIWHYPAGLQRLLLAWWYVIWVVLESTPVPWGHPVRALVLVGDDPMPNTTRWGSTFIIAFPPRLVYGGTTQMLWPLCHEMGEVAFELLMFHEFHLGVGNGVGLLGSDLELAVYISDSGVNLQLLEHWPTQEPGDGALSIWREDWRHDALDLWRQVFCDVYAAFALLQGNPGPALTYCAEQVADMAGDHEAIDPAFRAWVLATIAEDIERQQQAKGLRYRDAVRDPEFLEFLPELEAPPPTAGPNASARELFCSFGERLRPAAVDAEVWEPIWAGCVAGARELGFLDTVFLQATKVVAASAFVQASTMLDRAFAQNHTRIVSMLRFLQQWSGSAAAEQSLAPICQDLLQLSDAAIEEISRGMWD